MRKYVKWDISLTHLLKATHMFSRVLFGFIDSMSGLQFVITIFSIVSPGLRCLISRGLRWNLNRGTRISLCTKTPSRGSVRIKVGEPSFQTNTLFRHCMISPFPYLQQLLNRKWRKSDRLHFASSDGASMPEALEAIMKRRMLNT